MLDHYLYTATLRARGLGGGALRAVHREVSHRRDAAGERQAVVHEGLADIVDAHEPLLGQLLRHLCEDIKTVAGQKETKLQ